MCAAGKTRGGVRLAPDRYSEPRRCLAWQPRVAEGAGARSVPPDGMPGGGRYGERLSPHPGSSPCR